MSACPCCGLLSEAEAKELLNYPEYRVWRSEHGARWSPPEIIIDADEGE